METKVASFSLPLSNTEKVNVTIWEDTSSGKPIYSAKVIDSEMDTTYSTDKDGMKMHDKDGKIITDNNLEQFVDYIKRNYPFR